LNFIPATLAALERSLLNSTIRSHGSSALSDRGAAEIIASWFDFSLIALLVRGRDVIGMVGRPPHPHECVVSGTPFRS